MKNETISIEIFNRFHWFRKQTTKDFIRRTRTKRANLVSTRSIAKKTKTPAELICLSDDDNDDILPDEPSSTTSANSSGNGNESSNVDKDPDENDVNDPSNWVIEKKDLIRIPELPSTFNEIYKKPFEIRCSTIRFGIVEFSVDCEVVLMKDSEFEMRLKGGFLDTLSIKLSYTDVVAFYYSFRSETPAAFIQVRKEFARLFNRYIPNSDDQGRGFDPNAKDIKRRRIVFCLKPLTLDMEKIHISTIYHFLKRKCPNLDICCITATRAKELYELTRYARLPIVATKKPFLLHARDLMPKTVGVNQNSIRFDLSPDDLFCLNEGQFLNDNIIDFYLQYIFYEKLTEEDRQRTHLFNSFFYTRLTKKGKNDDPNSSGAERRYNRVKRWCRDVDIFSKEFLIVPINQTAHWYVIIIQHPNYVPTEGDMANMDDDETLADRLKSKKQERSERMEEPTSSTSENSSSVVKTNLPGLEFLDEADEAASDNEIEAESQVDSRRLGKNHSDFPAIVFFDSLRVHSKRRVAATLREFLQMEFDHKKNVTKGSITRKLFNSETIPMIEAAVPQQANYVDCGLYILQYVEDFFAHRSSTINFCVASTFSKWCNQAAMGSSKRKKILNVINQHKIVKVD